jgi:hypothetical protein
MRSMASPDRPDGSQRAHAIDRSPPSSTRNPRSLSSASSRRVSWILRSTAALIVRHPLEFPLEQERSLALQGGSARHGDNPVAYFPLIRPNVLETLPRTGRIGGNMRRAAVAASQKCLVMRLCRGPDAQRAQVPDAQRHRRVQQGVLGDSADRQGS